MRLNRVVVRLVLVSHLAVSKAVIEAVIVIEKELPITTTMHAVPELVDPIIEFSFSEFQRLNG